MLLASTKQYEPYDEFVLVKIGRQHVQEEGQGLDQEESAQFDGQNLTI